jgi:cardiolipin synthase
MEAPRSNASRSAFHFACHAREHARRVVRDISRRTPSGSARRTRGMTLRSSTTTWPSVAGTSVAAAPAHERNRKRIVIVAVFVVVLHAIAAAAAGGHAVLTKRDPRAAVAWVGFVVMVPLAGPLAYALFGINRVHRRARELRSDDVPREKDGIPAAIGPVASPALRSIARASSIVCAGELRATNRVELLEGAAAYEAMLAAIAGATTSIGLATYIFDTGAVGRRFVDALADARKRGVVVRVLVDAVGARYSWPPATSLLTRAGVASATFLDTLSPWNAPFVNLREHRKILAVDGRIAFTGGMNIRESCAGERPTTRDVHFRVRGPVVADIVDVFVRDWELSAREHLDGPDWFPPLDGNDDGDDGVCFARAIPDGPEDDRHPLRWTLLAAIGAATRSIQIVTPYFLPDQALIAALNTAALRGVAVDLVLPERSNIVLADWAMHAMLWQTLELGCRVHLAPAPFDHSKLMVVDDGWALVGSSNWDARSLRLNFELDLECYGDAIASDVAFAIDDRLARSRPLTLADVDGRPLVIKLRDGLARLLVPYL